MSKFTLSCYVDDEKFDLLDIDYVRFLKKRNIMFDSVESNAEIDSFCRLLTELSEKKPKEAVEVLEYLVDERFDRMDSDSYEVAKLAAYGQRSTAIRFNDFKEFMENCFVYDGCTDEKDIGEYCVENDLIGNDDLENYFDYEEYGRSIVVSDGNHLVTDIGTIYSPNLYETGEGSAPDIDDSEYRVCVEDLSTGKFVWVDLTECDSEEAEERLQKAVDSLGNPDEYIVSDTTCSIPCMDESELSVDEVTERAEYITEIFNRYDKVDIALCAAGAGDDCDCFRELIEGLDDGNTIIMPDAVDLASLGSYYVEASGELPSDFMRYVDAEAIGRDMEIEQTVIYLPKFNCAIGYAF